MLPVVLYGCETWSLILRDQDSKQPTCVLNLKNPSQLVENRHVEIRIFEF